jgi:hypothetical protein
VAARHAQTAQQRPDRLDDAFLSDKSIDQVTYTRQRDKLRQSLALARVDQHATTVDDLDVEGILAFAEEIWPSASRLWRRRHSINGSGCSRCFFSGGTHVRGRSITSNRRNRPISQPVTAG